MGAITLQERKFQTVTQTRTLLEGSWERVLVKACKIELEERFSLLPNVQVQYHKEVDQTSTK